MTKVIKGGTIVTADLHLEGRRADRGRQDRRIGPDLHWRRELDATGCYVMPGGIDPHTHLEMPFMGTYSADDFESGTRAALSGGTTMVVDFCLPAPGQSLLEALQMWDNKTVEGVAATIPSTWRSPGGASRCSTRWRRSSTSGINTFKHFMAYKGALMVNDDEMFASFQRCAELGALPLVHAENGDVVAALQQKLLADGNNGPEGHAYSRPPEVEGEATNRAIMIADMAGVPLYIVHVSCEQAHEAIRRARAEGHARLWRAADPAPDARRERVFQQGLGPCGAPRDVARRSATSSTRIRCGPACSRARCRWWRPTIAPSPPSRSASASATSPRSRTAPAGSRTACRCCGPRASTPAG